jgi:hypothetical protein
MAQSGFYFSDSGSESDNECSFGGESEYVSMSGDHSVPVVPFPVVPSAVPSAVPLPIAPTLPRVLSAASAEAPLEKQFLSFYIPYIPNDIDDSTISQTFDHHGIGWVTRIDYFDTGRWDWAKSAFVHLEEWYYTTYSDCVFETLENGCGEWKLTVPKFPGVFLIIKKMTTEKIPNTYLNIHQLAAKVAEMETKSHRDLILDQWAAELEAREAELDAREAAADQREIDADLREAEADAREDELEDREEETASELEQMQTDMEDMYEELQALRSEATGKSEATGTSETFVMDSTDFVDHYDACPPLTMADLVAQTKRMSISGKEYDSGSDSSSEQSAKRMRVRNSAELCGNN